MNNESPNELQLASMDELMTEVARRCENYAIIIQMKSKVGDEDDIGFLYGWRGRHHELHGLLGELSYQMLKQKLEEEGP